VRVGRSPLNELVVDHEYVSGIHGVLRFGAEGVSYVDMGSRNGSQANGQALKCHQPASLPPGAELVIGQFVLTAHVLPDPVRDHSDEGAEPPPGRYVFGAGGAATPATGQSAPTRGETTALPFGFDIRKMAPEPAPRRIDPPPTPAVAPSRPPDEPPVPLMQVGFTVPLPPPLSQEARSGLDSSAIRRLQDIGMAQPEASDREITVRAAALLELLVDKLIAFRDSVEISGRELGVRPFLARTPLIAERDPRQALEYLLLAAGGSAVGREEVARVFTDLFAHQVAFLGALREGVDALVERLHPSASGVEPGLFGGGAWKRYRERYDDEAERAWDMVLGPVFRQTYAELMSESTRALMEPDDRPLEDAAEPGHRLAPHPRLVIISGPVEAREFSLTAEEVVLGRAADCDIPLDHQSVSRRHARLAVVGGVWAIRDLDSANGVLVNGEKFREAELEAGDVVQIGLVQLRLDS
jgi:pSer/pThr/pTyr-binding forkhead associated (FHA) protein